MSHEIFANDTAIYNAKPAWHGLGTVLPDGELTVEKVREVAPGFVFPIEQRPILAGTWADGWDADKSEPTQVATVAQAIEVPGMVAQVAGDDGQVLGITTTSFCAFSNEELLSLVAEVSAFGEGQTLESVLTLKGRKVAVILAHVGGFSLPGGDDVREYLLWTSAHDGSSALRCLPVSIRVVCNNTLTMALDTAGRMGFSVRHTSGMADAVKAGIRAMQQGIEASQSFEPAAQALAGRDLTGQEVRDFFLDVYQGTTGPIPANPQNRGEVNRRNRARATVSRWLSLLDDPKNKLDGRTTAWSALNAVTQHSDHERTVKRTGGASTKQEARDWSRLMGTGADVKAKALDRALALVS